jgi:hypothetical protein
MPSKATYYLQAAGALAILVGFLLILGNPRAVGCFAAGALLVWGGWILRSKRAI